MAAFNAEIIADFRARDGHVAIHGFDSNIVLLHTVGAQSGQGRVNPVMFLHDEDHDAQGWLVVASAAGAPSDPAWMHNLRAHPDITIELPGEAASGPGDGIAEVAVHAAELTGDERDTAYAKFVAVAPGFADYEQKAGDRVIPVVRLTPRT